MKNCRIRLARIFHELLLRDCGDGCATGQPQGVGSEAYLNGTSQEPTLEDARKDGQIRGRSKPFMKYPGENPQQSPLPLQFLFFVSWCTWWCKLTDGNQVEITKGAQVEDKLTIRLSAWFPAGTVASFPPTDPQGVAGAQEKPLLLPLLPG